MRRVVVVVCLLLAVSWADAAKTPARVCRKACAPFVSTICPARGKALRTCRSRLVRACRRQGVAVCAIGLPTGGTEGGGAPPPTFPVATTTSTTLLPGAQTTTTSSLPGDTITGLLPTTTTLAPPPVVDGPWTFVGTLSQPGCGPDESFGTFAADLIVTQDGASLGGTVDDKPAAGGVRPDGWTFATLPDCRPVAGVEVSCCLSFSVASSGVVSPSPAEGTATASCDDGSACTARWTGSVARPR